MPTILTKKSDTPGSIPATANLTNAAGGAELAVNTADKRLFTINSTSQVVELGTNPSSITCADGSFTVARIGSGTVTQLTSTSATITTLTATSATVTNLTATSLVISNLSVASMNITTLTSASATITNLVNTSASITTLTNNPTFGAGTANGVLYLNGSKVATSGSAITYNGTTFGVDSAAVFNDSGADVDFRIEGDADANLFFVDASTDRIGVGTNAPTVKFTVSASAGAANTPVAWLHNSGNVADYDGVVISCVNDGSDAEVLHVRTNNTTPSNGTSLMLVRGDGNVGIGTSSPAYTLEVASGLTDASALFNSTAANGSHIRLASSGTVKNYIGCAAGFITGGAADDLGLRAVGKISFATNGAGADMVLDTSGNLGIGTSSPGNYSSAAYNLVIAGTGQRGMTIASTNSDQCSLFFADSDTGTGEYAGYLAYFHNTDGLAFGANAAEQMRLTSTGLGIGTSSPAYKLDVSGTFRVAGASNFIVDSFGAVQAPAGVYVNTTGTRAAGINSSGADLGFRTGNTDNRMVLDASGNLGLGVTPSAWRTSEYKAIQVGVGGSFYGRVQSGDADKVGMSGNAFFDQTDDRWEYIATDSASRYDQGGGAHFWYTAPSGTAGNTITFTQAMTLDASGNLLVGKTVTTNTTPGIAISSGLYAATASSTSTNLATNNGAALNLINSSATDGNFSNIGAYNSNGLVVSQIDFINVNHASRTGDIAFLTHNGSSLLERARITADGNFGVGTGGPTYKIEGWVASSGTLQNGLNITNGANADFTVKIKTSETWIGPGTNTPLIFANNSNTERARITAGGYSKFSNAGTYQGSTGSYHELRQSADETIAFVTNTANSLDGTVRGIRVLYNNATPNNTTNNFLYCDDSTQLRASIRSNGGLANYQSNNVDLSDARTKNSITPAASMWNKIGALEIVTYKYNDQTHDDVNVGVIAQQVESVEPVWVDADGFGETPEGEEPLKTVYTKDITFAAIKALQEAMARIEKLEAEMAALKGA